MELPQIPVAVDGEQQPHPRHRAPVTDAIRENTTIYVALLAGVLGMSLLDGLLTTVEVTFGIAREANPVLQAFFGFSPLMALLFKVVLTILVVLAMWRGRDSRLITRIALGTFLGYGALIAYHLGSLAGYRLI